MRLLLDAFWRAAAYCLHPRVILLSTLPLLVAGGATALLGYFYWADAVAAARSAMASFQLLAALFQWLDAIGASAFRSLLAPLVILALGVSIVVVVSLLVVAWLMTPALVRLVASRRFPDLEQRHGATLLQSLFNSLGCTLLALLALVVSLPFWFIPPLMLLLPPLIWGWLAYRVMAFDVLAEHASTEERRTLLRTQRWPLLGMGVVAVYLGAAPSLVWAFSAFTLIFAPLLILVAIWLYTLVFALSGLWFAHYALASLDALRSRQTLAATEASRLPALADEAPARLTHNPSVQS